MDDLISRSALKEEIESLTMIITGLRSGKSMFRDFMNEYKKSVLRIVDEQPTAYNVGKVVEQLDANAQKMSEAKAIRPYAKSSPADHRYYKAISVKKAKEIVKAGGVNG